MKKLALFLLGICIFLSSCNPNDKNEINYDGKNSIEIVLLEEYDLGITSKSELSYYSDNEMVVTINENGVIKGKNVGEANVTIENEVNQITIKVTVNIFEEPTTSFGLSPKSIENIYGAPNYNFGDTIYRYGGGNDWYSYAVWRMDFFFKYNSYYECDLYINSDLDIRIDQFLSDNYHYYQTITDTIAEEIVTLELFLNDSDVEDASVLVGKQENAGYYNDICLFYVPFDYAEKSITDRIGSRKRKLK